MRKKGKQKRPTRKPKPRTGETTMNELLDLLGLATTSLTLLKNRTENFARFDDAELDEKTMEHLRISFGFVKRAEQALDVVKQNLSAASVRLAEESNDG